MILSLPLFSLLFSRLFLFLLHSRFVHSLFRLSFGLLFLFNRQRRVLAELFKLVPVVVLHAQPRLRRFHQVHVVSVFILFFFFFNFCFSVMLFVLGLLLIVCCCCCCILLLFAFLEEQNFINDEQKMRLAVQKTQHLLPLFFHVVVVFFVFVFFSETNAYALRGFVVFVRFDKVSPKLRVFDEFTTN